MLWLDPNHSSFKSDAPFALLNARVPAACVGPLAPSLPHAGDGLVAADIHITHGKFNRLTPPKPQAKGLDLAQAMVWPCPVDCHTHIDKGQVWGRSANTDGSFAEALRVTAIENARVFSAEDQRARSEFMLMSAHAHGSQALRSHVDADQRSFDSRFNLLCELAQDWQGRLLLQLAPFTGPEEPQDWVETLARCAAQTPHSGVLSAFLYSCPGLEPFLDHVFRLAAKYGLALDFHADETLDPTSHCLRKLAEAVLRHRFQGPVLAGHCCALSVQSADDCARTLDLVARAGITVVSLPLCNAYLMDRGPDTPRLRGVPPVHQMRARGIPVALASDNSRDAFYAYGDLDPVALFRDAVKLMHLDHPVGDWPDVVLGQAGQAIGRPDLGRITAGLPADLILFNARNWSEFMARSQHDRVVLRRGKPIDTTPPDFRRLDTLKGSQP